MYSNPTAMMYLTCRLAVYSVLYRWNMPFQPLLYLCVCMCVSVGAVRCVCVCLPKAEWCPCWFCSSSSLSCSTQCVCLLGRLACSSSVAPQRPRRLWGVKNFHLCISLDKKNTKPIWVQEQHRQTLWPRFSITHFTDSKTSMWWTGFEELKCPVRARR